MGFIPETPKESVKVPYYDNVKSSDGWQGQTTTKSIDTLKAEIASAVGRLGGLVSSFQSGSFDTESQKRDGFRIHYSIQTPNGKYVPGRIDIAALPIKTGSYYSRTEKARREKSLRMALYMTRIAFEGSWFLMQLSPGYAPMIPFMLADAERTVSQMWIESPTMKMLAPPKESVFVEGVVVE